MTIEVPSTEVDAAYERVLKKLSLKVKSQGFRPGEVTVADREASADGVKVPSAGRKAMEIEVKEGVLIPELTEAVIGKSVDEVAEAEVQMPADTAEPELSNKLAKLRLTVRGVKQKDLPPLNDHTAAAISNGEQQTALELKIAVRRDLEEGAQRLDELRYEQDVLKALVDASKVEVPASMVDHEVAHQLEELEGRVQRQGLKLDRYFAYSGTTANEWAAKARPDAESRLKVDLVLEKASKLLSVNPTTEEVYSYLLSEANQDEELKGQVEQLTQNRTAVDYFRHRLTRLRTLEALTKLAAGESAVQKPDTDEAYW